MKINQGFTLIELMIVVAIIAILASIAIPQYNDYVARAQISEAITLLGGQKVNIAEAYASDSSVLSCVIPPAAVVSGKYVANIVTGVATATTCQLVASFNANVSNLLVGKTVSVNYNVVTGSWTCTSNAVARVRPKGC